MTTPYIGRFAPSPTGPMHFGTLIAAVVSYLQAKSHGGRWLLRIEDVDVLRRIDGADRQIIDSLEYFGFEWDGDIVYQTDRTEAYDAALEILKGQGRVFPCTCSRKQLAAQTGEWSPVYPGTCRQRDAWDGEDHAVRLRVDDVEIRFDDTLFGEQSENIVDTVGDFVIKRRDGLFAYQLAVVVDDAWQGVTEVVRGTDLMDSTSRQIFLQNCLGLRHPHYFHFPTAVDASGNKLSKSAGSTAIDDTDAIHTLNRVLSFLGQNTIESDTLDGYWETAIADWDTDRISRVSQIELS